MKKVIENKLFFKTVTDSLKQNESVSFYVKGTSMSPFFINKQTEVFLKTKEDYYRNDVCLFLYKGHYLLHRLIKVKDDGYYFRGDHLYGFEVVKKQQILAYVYRFKKGKRWVDSKQRIYRLSVFVYLSYKSFKLLIRKVYRGIKYGHSKKR